MIIRHDFRGNSTHTTNRHPAGHRFDRDRRVLVGFDLIQQLLMPSQVVSSAVTLSTNAFETLDKSRFSDLEVRIVYAPLLGMRIDALDVAERLSSFGFNGDLIAVASHLPQGDVALRELRGACPGAQVQIVAFETLLAASA